MRNGRPVLTVLLGILLVSLVVVPGPLLAGKPRLWVFDTSRNPTEMSWHDFVPELAGKGTPGKWLVVEDPEAPSLPNVYAQFAGDPNPARHPLALVRHGNFTDFSLAVKVKLLSGKTDQAAGLVFRLDDTSNFYALQASARENSFKLYKVVKGIWTVIGNASVPVAANRWHTLQVKAHGWAVKGFLNGAHLITSSDKTFERGKVGMTTAADTIAQFDDLLLHPKDYPDDYPPHPRTLYYKYK